MKCKICGKQMDEKEKFCPNCGAKKESKEENNKQKNSLEQTQKEKEEATILCVTSLILMHITPIMFLVGDKIFPNAEVLVGLFPVYSIVIMIIARVKYPNSLFAKIVMWIIIADVIVLIIAFIVLVAFSIIFCYGCINWITQID